MKSKPTIDDKKINSIKLICEKCYKEIDVEFSSKCEVMLCDYDEYSDTIKSLYTRKYKWFKNQYSSNVNDISVDDTLIVTSIICRSIIGYKPINYNRKKAETMVSKKKKEIIKAEELLEWRVSNEYVNYKIAMYAVLELIKSSIQDWVKKKIEDSKNTNKEVYNKFNEKIKNYNVSNVSALKGIDVNSLIVSLASQDILKRDFDYLLFREMLSLTQERIKINILEEIRKETKGSFLSIDLL